MRRLISRASRGVKDIIWHAKTFACTADLFCLGAGLERSLSIQRRDGWIAGCPELLTLRGFHFGGTDLAQVCLNFHTRMIGRVRDAHENLPMQISGRRALLQNVPLPCPIGMVDTDTHKETVEVV
jgi:hypothetical protein